MISDRELECIFKNDEWALTQRDVTAMAKELLALRKAFSEPVAFQNNYTGKLWRSDQQPGAEQDSDVYTPLYRNSSREAS